MLGSDVVAVKGMHNHPPRSLGVPARRTPARKHHDTAAGAALPDAHTINTHIKHDWSLPLTFHAAFIFVYFELF